MQPYTEITRQTLAGIDIPSSDGQTAEGLATFQLLPGDIVTALFIDIRDTLYSLVSSVHVTIGIYISDQKPRTVAQAKLGDAILKNRDVSLVPHGADGTVQSAMGLHHVCLPLYLRAPTGRRRYLTFTWESGSTDEAYGGIVGIELKYAGD